MRGRILLPVLAILVLVITSCGTQQEPATMSGVAAYLPAQLGETGITRTDDVRLFVGDSLYEYIDGGAEVYHQYGFVEVATAQYRLGDDEFIADIYRFADSDNAYGMFSTLRPDEFDTAPFGAGGFADGPTVVFVKGKFIVNLIGYDASPTMVSAVQAAAVELNNILPGTTDLPSMFSNFPADNRIAATERVIAESYLGQAALSEVYTLDYQWDGDTVTLFMTKDNGGEKYLAWSGRDDGGTVSTPDWPDNPFDDGQCIMIDNSYYGLILAGLKAPNMIGVVGFKDACWPAINSWTGQLTPRSTPPQGE